ncbi:hypothetical protein [Pantanalinema sp. GBBB05]
MSRLCSLVYSSMYCATPRIWLEAIAVLGRTPCLGYYDQSQY